MNHEVLFGDDREIFVMIKEDNLEFEHILLQLRSEIALSLIWSPSFKSLQITSSFFFVVTYDTRLLKNVPVPGLCSSYYSLRRTRFWEVYVDFPRHGSQPFWPFSSPSLLYMVRRHVFKQRFKSRLNQLRFWLIFLLCSGGNFSNCLFCSHFMLGICMAVFRPLMCWRTRTTQF